jgi:hypothetical protein
LAQVFAEALKRAAGIGGSIGAITTVLQYQNAIRKAFGLSEGMVDRVRATPTVHLSPASFVALLVLTLRSSERDSKTPLMSTPVQLRNGRLLTT